MTEVKRSKPYPPKLQQVTRPLGDGTTQGATLLALADVVAWVGRDEVLFKRLQQVCRGFYFSISRSAQGASLAYYRRRYSKNYASHLNQHCQQFYQTAVKPYDPIKYRDNALEHLSANVKILRSLNDPTLAPRLTDYDWLFIPFFLSSETKKLFYDAEYRQEGPLVIFESVGTRVGHNRFSARTGQDLLHRTFHSKDCPEHKKLNWREDAEMRKRRCTEVFSCVHCWMGGMSEHAPRFLNATERDDPLINRYNVTYETPEGYVEHVKWWFDQLTKDETVLIRLDAASLVDVLTHSRKTFEAIVTHPNISLCLGHVRKGTIVQHGSIYDYFVVIQAAALLEGPVQRMRNLVEMKKMTSHLGKGSKMMMKKAKLAAESCLSSKKRSYTLSMAEYLLDEAEARLKIEEAFFSLWKGK